jgi:hypothetical protein
MDLDVHGLGVGEGHGIVVIDGLDEEAAGRMAFAENLFDQLRVLGETPGGGTIRKNHDTGHVWLSWLFRTLDP